MNRISFPDISWPSVGAGLAILLVLAVIQAQNFLLFHSLVELASILVAFAVFIIVWNARDDLENVFLGVLGVGYLFIGGLDLLHTLAYEGMGVFPVRGADLPTQLWIFTRYLEAIVLLGSGILGYAATQTTRFERRWEPRNIYFLVAGFAIVVSAGLATIFHFDTFPQAYIAGEGLTAFKVVSEYVIIGLLALALATIYAQRSAFERRVYWYITLAVILTMGAELAFTFYVSVYGFSNAVGHFFKLGSFYFVYLAVVKRGITDPQRHLYHSLATREREMRQYKETVESSIDLLAAVDTDKRFLFANDTYCDYHDIDPETIEGKRLRDVLDEPSFEAMKGTVEKALSGHQSRKLITRNTPARGERFLDVREFPIRDENGDIRGAGASMRDITEQKEHERHLETLVNNLPGIVYRCRNEEGWPMELVRGRSTELTGYSADEIERGDLSWGADIIHPDDQTFVWEEIQTAVGSEDPFEITYRIVTRTGEEKWVWERGQPVRQIDSAQLKLEGFITDITDRKRLEEELREAKERYESLFKSIRDAILVADTDRRIINCNPAFTDLFGYELADIEGKRTAVVFESEAEYEAMGEAIDGQIDDPLFTTEVTYEKKSGQTFPGETSVFYLRNADNEIVGLIGVIRDVSDRKRQLRQLQIVDRVLQHNFHNDMNVIQGYADNIETRASPPLSDYARKIKTTGRELLDTVENERRITKFLSDPPPAEPLAVREVCEEVIEKVSATYPQATVETDYSGSTSLEVTVAVELAIEELLTNSIIHASTENPWVSLQVKTMGDQVKISVRDRNVPIPDMEQKVITGEEELGPLYHGSGMGLWLVSLIVTHADGTLEFEANDPKGNVVSILLPLE